MRLEGDRIAPPEGLVWAQWHFIGYGSGFVFQCGPRGVSAFIGDAYQGSVGSRETPESYEFVVDSLLYHGNGNQHLIPLLIKSLGVYVHLSRGP